MFLAKKFFARPKAIAPAKGKQQRDFIAI